jgi:hypothetical protein
MGNVWSDLFVDQWVAVCSAAVAALSLGLSLLVVQRQVALQSESLKAPMDVDILHWSNEAIDALSEAIFLARGRGEAFAEDALRVRRMDALQRISAIADKGRLFFPNLAPDQHGADKEGAFKGFRPPVLDCLIFAFYKLERMDIRALAPDLDTCDFITRCRRTLVSDLQRAIDPRRRSRMLKTLALSGSVRDPQGSREVAALAQDLEAKHPGVLIEKRDEAWIAEMEKRAKTVR